MKRCITTLISLFLLSLCGSITACSPDAYVDMAGTVAERHIPADLYLETFFKHINPGKDYDYWTLIKREIHPEKFTNVLQVGDKLKKNSIKYKDNQFSDFYIAAIINNNVYYYELNEEIVSFLGEIDTMQEALILAHCFNYEINASVGANSYHIINGDYVMRLLNKNYMHNCTEIAEVTITKKGFIRTRVAKGCNQ